ncbi:(Fe-S)-binding protein [Desulfitobacterium hafniense]|uniref:(Fe-S)-binding protein n=1 Tax=Desulfitobacterium hafniense TaxID=49338 RepID=UPI00037B7975|nr:(Fe-S)-binding protein [Desulfitobacterium hafniense]
MIVATNPIEMPTTVERKMPPVLELIRGNIVKYGNPLALKGSEVSSWAKELKLPKTGNLLFYTGGEYQLLPYIDSLVKTMTVMDPNSAGFSMLMGVRNIVEKTGIAPEKIYASVLASDKERFNQVSLKAARILQSLGYDLCYSGDEELYSGALLYELGYWDDFAAYAQKVTKVLKGTQAKTIVCLSPHAAEVIKIMYPKFGVHHDLEVKTFVELVWEQRHKLPKIAAQQSVVIHDSCRLARDLGVTEEIREILDAMGVEFKEPMRNRAWTTCCGGPNKFMFPELSHTIAERRVGELQDTGADLILTSCPYCLSSLQGAIDKKDQHGIADLIEFLYKGIVG